MKKSSWLITLIIVVAASVLATTSIYGWDWFGMKKEVKPVTVIQPSTGVPIPDLSIYKPDYIPTRERTTRSNCGNAYKNMKDALAATTVRPFASISYRVGTTREGGSTILSDTYTMACYAVANDFSDPGYPLLKSTSSCDIGDRPSELGKCWAGYTGTDWPITCYRPELVYNALHSVFTGLMSRDPALTYDILMDPNQPMNHAGNTSYNGFSNYPDRIPYFYFSEYGGLMARGELPELAVFRAMAGYPAAVEAERAINADHKWIVCFDSNLQYFEDGCR